MQHTLQFQSELNANTDTAWRWITSFDGINTELAPLLFMTAPSHVRTLTDVDVVYGEPLFRSWLKLFGLLPIDYSKLTLVELEEGVGFTECSRMGSMKVWQHERKIVATPTGSRVTDTLTFESYLPGFVVKPFVTTLFKHRHKKLQRHFNG